jgi:NADH-quinone oxidoreductase subunit G
VEEEGLTELVDVSATFCSERCDKGPTVQVGEEILTHADTEKVMGLVRPRIAAIKAPA